MEKTNSVIPFIDSHSHIHGLPYDTWETLGATGIAATILSAGNPHALREIHKEVPDLIDIQRFWDGPINLAELAEEKHFFKAFVAIGISMMTKVNQWEQAIELMPKYLKHPLVVAIGETGIDPVQYFNMVWPIDEQKQALTEQVQIAKDLNIPLILHTPSPKKGHDFRGFNLGKTDIPAENYKRHFLEMDLDIINRIGLDHRKLVIDHVDDTIIDFVLNETNSYVGIGVGVTFRNTNPQFFADIVERYGPDRLMINSDYVAYISCDWLAIPKAIREMRRRSIDPKAIQQVVFDNANIFYDLAIEI